MLRETVVHNVRVKTYTHVDVKVYAIDLLGFGASEKPIIDYTIELWAELLVDFTAEFVDQPYVMVGNSIGSLISLQAAKLQCDKGDAPQPCGIVLINCAGAHSTNL